MAVNPLCCGARHAWVSVLAALELGAFLLYPCAPCPVWHGGLHGIVPVRTATSVSKACGAD